jgi:hypothetical protein
MTSGFAKPAERYHKGVNSEFCSLAGGSGGKGTWTGSGKFELPDDLGPVDKNDPNYDSDEVHFTFIISTASFYLFPSRTHNK